jgi:hypothetical protein
MLFNINEKVKVKLTDKGRAIHREHWAPFSSTDYPYSPPKEIDGWTEFQLWDLMAIFGEHIVMGVEPPFETTIDISVNPGASHE